MKPIWISLLLSLALGACGGSPRTSRGPDEVTATWTAGDDAPLEDDDAPPADAREK